MNDSESDGGDGGGEDCGEGCGGGGGGCSGGGCGGGGCRGGGCDAVVVAVAATAVVTATGDLAAVVVTEMRGRYLKNASEQLRQSHK